MNRLRSVLCSSFLLGALLAGGASGLAQESVPPARPEAARGERSEDGNMQVELTVYNSDLGLVKETRSLDLIAGENQVRYSNVAARIDPTSVHLTSLGDPSGLVVLEQNYEYDIVSSSKLLSKYVDQEVTVRTANGDVYTGTLLSGAGDLVLAMPDGVKVIKQEQVTEFSFPNLPAGLITKPTLVWQLWAESAGEQQVRVNYLTSGINWRADYIALLAPDDDALALTGWVSLENRCGASYEDARLKLVAGDVHRVSQQTRMYGAMAEAEEDMMAPKGVEERALFEYHVYEVQRPVSVLDQQIKQIEFVAAPVVGASKVFVYAPSPPYYSYSGVITDRGYGATSDAQIQVRIEFANRESSGLGIPLPAGRIRIYKEDVDGGAEFVGEDTISHTPIDEGLTLNVGNAFDLVGDRRQIAYRQVQERVVEETYEITLRNHKGESVIVRAIEHLFRAHDATIVKSDRDYTMVDANTARWDVPIEAGGETRFTYTVVYRW